jgi:hypothetical protein
MSIVGFQGEKVDLGIDKSALALREALAQMDVAEMRAFTVNFFRMHRAPMATIAKALNCSERAARRYGAAFQGE